MATSAAPPRSMRGRAMRSTCMVCVGSWKSPTACTSASGPVTSRSSLCTSPPRACRVPSTRSKARPLLPICPSRASAFTLSSPMKRAAPGSTRVMLPCRTSSRMVPPTVFQSTAMGEPRQRTVPATTPAPPDTRSGRPKCASSAPRSSVSTRTRSATRLRWASSPSCAVRAAAARAPPGVPHRPLPCRRPCGVVATRSWMRHAAVTGTLPSSVSVAPASCALARLLASRVTRSKR